MKTFAAIAAVALLANSAAAATCDSATLTALLTDQYIDQCSTDSGYDFTNAVIPTQSVIDLMCASSACRSLLADAQAMNLTECTLPVGDNINLLADLIDYVPPRCPSASGSSSVTAGSTATDTNSTSSSDTITAPSTASSTTSSTASSTTSSSTGSTTTTSAPTTSSESSASAAASASSSSDASVTRAVSAASLAIVAIGAYFL